MIKYLIAVFFSCSLIIGLSSYSYAQQKDQVRMRNANSTNANKSIGEGVRRLLGNVILEHNNTIMYCDSAYLFSNRNVFHAYSNVHVNKGDTLHMYGDFMLYDGNTSIGKVRNNVRLEDDSVTLYTDSLDFNTLLNIGYYFDGGEIINGDNNLKSIIGHYYANEDLFYFKDSVVVLTPDYIINTDTLKYHTTTETAFFLGPTNIYNEENVIYAENGWHKIKEKKFQFNENAVFQNKEKILKGDSLYIDDLNGISIAIENIEIIDTIEHMILKGNYAYYTEEPESFLITDSALLIQVSNYTDSLFMHADTISSAYDSSGMYRILKAFNKVKIFREDFQALCDSMVYDFEDSVITMYTEPVLWAEGSQITAEKIEIHTKNEKIDFFKLMQSAFIISQKDTARFDQIKGKEMIGYISKNKLYKVDVFGNGQTIYFTKDKEDITSVNYAESTDLILYFNDGKVDRINLIKQPEGILYPLDKLEETELKDFKWLENLRPKSKNDIFIWD